MPKIAVQIVTFNSMQCASRAMQTLEQQTFQDFMVTIIDNASSDNVIEYFREHYPTITTLQNRKNLGFAFAHNQGIALALHTEAKPEYVLVMNPDVELDPNFLENILRVADAHPEAGSFSGKLLRTHDPSAPLIDSTGLLRTYSYRIYERGAGEQDHAQYDTSYQITGVTGGLGFYRLSALQSIAPDNEFFDSDFFMYKEDADVALRLQKKGWPSWYVPSAIAFHPRTLKKPVGNFFSRFRQELQKPEYLKFLSYRNQALLLLKNLSIKEWLIHLPGIIFEQTIMSGMLLIFRPRIFFNAVYSFMTLSPRMIQKRRMLHI